MNIVKQRLKLVLCNEFIILLIQKLRQLLPLIGFYPNKICENLQATNEIIYLDTHYTLSILSEEALEYPLVAVWILLGFE